MNSRLADLLTKQVTNKILGTGNVAANPPGEDGEQPGQLPPFVSGLLARFGITPEAIMSYAEAIKQSVAAIQYNTAFAVEQNKVIIQNQKTLWEELVTIQNQLDPTMASKAPIMATMDGTPVDVENLTSAIVDQINDPSKHN